MGQTATTGTVERRQLERAAMPSRMPMEPKQFDFASTSKASKVPESHVQECERWLVCGAILKE